MNSLISRPGGSVRHRTLTLLTAAALLPISASRAVEVDSELLLLVDTSFLVTPQNFTDTMEGFAQTFEDPNFLSTLQSGPNGRIAASLAVFSGPGNQAVTVPWTSISDASSAQAFADNLRNSSRPFANFTTSFVEAFGFATDQFGDETGGPGNGFESSTQVINITSESFLIPNESAAAVQAATSQAIFDGVDVINAMVVGTFNAQGAADYYTNNVVGGSAGGEPGAVSSSPDYGTLSAEVLASLETQIAVAVPEPSTLSFSLAGLLLLARRRRC